MLHLSLSTCQTRETPAHARLLQAAPSLRGHPNGRALVVCERRGQRWRLGFLHIVARGGAGAGRGDCAPGPEAVSDTACATLSTGDVATRHPRVVIDDFNATPVDRAA